ncbi:hypothetical protein [Jiangella anatolica]|uniref:Uncharacterized protein n=1 Tax=Jiangella anatolica TaxID=2670374 RepID=A0A2W2BK29_9ACTN|nr:hypothetical protein [Jiangella anatolica]PZF80694.1 hypothetical protein C1I92_24550 [Jiangella anatolica]
MGRRRREEDPAVFTNRDRELVLEAMAAEQNGDLARAFGYLHRTPHRLGSPWADEVGALLTLGDRAEAWQWARFAVSAAQRWIGVVSSPLTARVEREVCAGAGISMAPGRDDHSWRGLAERTALARTAANVLLFDELLLEVFLVRIAPELAERGGGGRNWAATPGRVYELGELTGNELRVRAHGSGNWQSVRHLGEAVGPAPDALLYGRLLEVPGLPALVFASPPIVVDQAAAQRLERLDESRPRRLVERCKALGAAARSGVTYLPAPPDYDADPAAGVRLLMEQGLDRVAAEQFAVVQSMVAMHGVDPDSTPVYAYHAAGALSDPPVEVEVRRRLVGPGYAALWKAWAAASNGLDRERFLSLAAAEPP